MEQHTLSPVVQQYGRLLEAVVLPDEREDLQKTCERLAEFLLQDEENWRVLSRGGWSARVQRQIMDKILDKIQSCDFMRRFVHLLIQHRRLEKLLPILSFYEDSARSEGREVAFLTTAQEVNPESIQKIEEILSAFSPSAVLLRHEVDASLLGGGILLWRGFMLDGSAKTLLDSFTI